MAKNISSLGAKTWAAGTTLCLALCGIQAMAQSPTVLTNPEVQEPIQFDISPPLTELAKLPVPQTVGYHQAPAVQIPRLQMLEALAAKNQTAVDGALQSTPGPLVSATLGLNLLGVGVGFPGYSVPDAPTDVNLAVGDTQVVQWVNVSYAIFNKTTGAVEAGPVNGNQFWAGFGGACQANNDGDPIVQFDKHAHRWVMAQNVFASPYKTCIAVSLTADATGRYYRYVYTQPGFPDYPKWGIWSDAYYQAQNNFGPGGSGFQGARACAYESAKLLVGDHTAKQICFQATVNDDSMLPADIDSVALPPAGQPELFLGTIDTASTGVTTIYQYLFHVDFTTPSNSTFTGLNESMPLTVAAFNLGCGGFSACIPQLGTSSPLDSLGDRLMYRLAYRNFPKTPKPHQTWLVSHNVNTTAGQVGERWYEFHAPETSTTLSVFQQSTFAPDTTYRWMGSLAMDKQQNILLGYSTSSATTYPAIKFTGRVPSDPLNTMETEATIILGTGSQVGTANRWGDYTSMALDVYDECTFWYTNQWYMTTGSFAWSTQLASAKFPNCK